MTTNKKITSNDKNDDFNSKLVLTAGILLLGAFFAINPGNLTAFAAVFPDSIDNSTGDYGPVHPGDLLTVKNVTLDDHGLEGLVNVTFAVYNNGTTTACEDLTKETVITLTTENVTENIDATNEGYLLYDEFFVGMPGVYHCDIVFTADNGTDTAIIGNQTALVDVIGSKGYWKNHPNATEQHLDGLLLGDYLVGDNETATEIFKEHKGKWDLDKLAGQLLAAKLNIWALNMTEPFDKVDCVAQNVTDADDYLAEADYVGVDTVVGHKKDKSEKAFALAIQSDLDDFNNYGCSQP